MDLIQLPSKSTVELTFFFVKHDKCVRKSKHIFQNVYGRAQNIYYTSEKKRKEKSLALPDIKTYEKATVIKTWMSLAHRQSDQQNEIAQKQICTCEGH